MNMNVYVNEQFPYLDFMDIRPGDRVVLKPNLVKEGKETDKNEWKCVRSKPFGTWLWNVYLYVVCGWEESGYFEEVCKSVISRN